MAPKANLQQTLFVSKLVLPGSFCSSFVLLQTKQRPAERQAQPQRQAFVSDAAAHLAGKRSVGALLQAEPIDGTGGRARRSGLTPRDLKARTRAAGQSQLRCAYLRPVIHNPVP